MNSSGDGLCQNLSYHLILINDFTKTPTESKSCEFGIAWCASHTSISHFARSTVIEDNAQFRRTVIVTSLGYNRFCCKLSVEGLTHVPLQESKNFQLQYRLSSLTKSEMPDAHDNYPQVTPTEMQIATHLTELNTMGYSNTSPNNPDILVSAGLIVNESETSTTAASSISTIVANLLRAICSLPDPTTFQEQGCHICLNDFSTSAEHPIQLPCGHIFGLSCLVAWTKEKLYINCPMCRIQYLDPLKSLEVCRRRSTSDLISQMIDRMIRDMPTREMMRNQENMQDFDVVARDFYLIIGKIEKRSEERSERINGSQTEIR